MLLLFLVLYLRTSYALLLTTDNRISTRNITCKHDLASTTTIYVQNCEACLITLRNYPIETTLSLTGSGLAGFAYTCLQVNQVEMYHENLIRECHYFPQNTLSGYDDFCIASPYTFVRGSYRACICTTNTCNFNYTQCMRETNRFPYEKKTLFTNTIMELTNRVKCYQPYEDYREQSYSNLIPLCSDDDDICKNYLYNQGVLCAISVDRTNKIIRQTLIPSIYSAYLIKYKTQFCKTYTDNSKYIIFSQCELEETVCMCTSDECNKDFETCRTNEGIRDNDYLVLLLFVFLMNICI